LILLGILVWSESFWLLHSDGGLEVVLWLGKSLGEVIILLLLGILVWSKTLWLLHSNGGLEVMLWLGETLS